VAQRQKNRACGKHAQISNPHAQEAESMIPDERPERIHE
jgi:hypothetical protein